MSTRIHTHTRMNRSSSISLIVTEGTSYQAKAVVENNERRQIEIIKRVIAHGEEHIEERVSAIKGFFKKSGVAVG